MKYILSLLMAFGLIGTGYCQNTIEVTLPDYYKGDGIIFTTNYELPFTLESANRFTPTSSEIKLTETYLLGCTDSVSYDSTFIKVYGKSDLVQKFWKYNRQYVAYRDENGDRNIIVHMLNFKKERKAKEMFAGWETAYIIGFGEFYEKNTMAFSINLDKKKVSIF